ncbi:hypothetical protein B0J11DRAFT_526078 [Dendryphion nanum]|uniref:Uncharacterized protein n=1 Tax=Dendryphion nanum TaxID=256645 RepID=A0A9P9IPK3_9PLEO|nr:hypothetical protein B0J11DRAFT_526078 [Dendryphion nanum]
MTRRSTSFFPFFGLLGSLVLWRAEIMNGRRGSTMVTLFLLVLHTEYLVIFLFPLYVLSIFLSAR